MKRTERTPCLCGCGQTFARPKSWPLCRVASQRVHSAFREQVRLSPPENYQRAYSQFYGNAGTVSAAAVS